MFSIIFLKEPYSPSHLIWMHSNNHSKQWSLFSTMCLKEKIKRSDSVLWQCHFINRNVKQAKRQQNKNATKRLDYTAIVDRLRTVSWSSYRNSYPTGVVNWFTGPFWKNHTPPPIKSEYIATITRNSDSCSLQCVWKNHTLPSYHIKIHGKNH